MLNYMYSSSTSETGLYKPINWLIQPSYTHMTPINFATTTTMQCNFGYTATTLNMLSELTAIMHDLCCDLPH